MKQIAWPEVVFMGCLIYSTSVMAGEDDSYHYKLEISHNDKLCRHMESVYNQYFKHPFPVRVSLADYNEGGRFALPMLPNIKRDPRQSMKTRFSLQATSPEFDAVKWREGRVKYPEENIGEQPVMVADIDIDNDGSIETVIKFSFLAGYVLAAGGGEDSLAIYRQGSVDLIKQPLIFDALYRGQDGRQPPAHISGSSYGFNYQVIRIFNYDGMNYLSAYGQQYLRKNAASYDPPDREYLDVLQYHSGGDNLGKGSWSPLKMDTICKFLMKVAN
jgi:hypothetical protein